MDRLEFVERVQLGSIHTDTPVEQAASIGVVAQANALLDIAYTLRDIRSLLDAQINRA